MSNATVNNGPAIQTKGINFSLACDVQEIVLPDTPNQLARSLYATLRTLDQLNVDIIYFEKLPIHEEWDAIRDRLGRASVGSGV